MQIYDFYGIFYMTINFFSRFWEYSLCFLFVLFLFLWDIALFLFSPYFIILVNFQDIFMLFLTSDSREFKDIFKGSVNRRNLSHDLFRFFLLMKARILPGDRKKLSSSFYLGFFADQLNFTCHAAYKDL